MNITKVDGSYSKELFKNIHKIKSACYSKHYTLSSMKDLVLEIIATAFINASAKPRFIGYLNDCQSKYEVYSLCWNTIKKAMNYKPGCTY